MRDGFLPGAIHTVEPESRRPERSMTWPAPPPSGRQPAT